MYPNQVPLEERIWFFEDISAVDTGIHGTLSYHGPEASGLIQIAGSSSDLTFEHGDLGAEVVDTDVKLDASAVGVIDLSVDVTDWNSLANKINSSDNWHFAIRGARPDLDPEASGTGYIITQTDGDCNVTSTSDGFDFLNDNSGSLGYGIGVTFDGPRQKIHGSDHGVLHVITRVDVTTTFAGGVQTLTAYECDDDKGGGVTSVRTWATGSTTNQAVYPLEENAPTFEVFTRGKRLLFEVRNTTTNQTSPIIKVQGWSYAYGPGLRKHKLYSQY